MRKILVIVLLTLLAWQNSCQSKRPPSRVGVDHNSLIKPAAPTNIKAGSAVLSIVVSWKKNSDASSYNIYWSDKPGVTKQSHPIERVLADTYTHSPLSADKTYYYRLSSIGSGGEGELSEEFHATPSPGATKASPTPQPPASSSRNCSISANGAALTFVSDRCDAPPCLFHSTYKNAQWTKAEIVANGTPKDIHPAINETGSIIAYATPTHVQILTKDGSSWRQSDKVGSGTSSPIVNLSNDGMTLAWGKDGKVYISKKGATWSTPASLASSALSFDLSAGGGNLALEDASQTKIYEFTTSWQLTHSFPSLSKPQINSDATVLAAALGSSFIAKHFDGSAWQDKQISFSTCCSGSFALSQDGTTLVYTDQFSIYQSAGNWPSLAKLDKVTESPSLSANGRRLCFHAKSRVYAATRAGNTWTISPPID